MKSIKKYSTMTKVLLGIYALLLILYITLVNIISNSYFIQTISIAMGISTIVLAIALLSIVILVCISLDAKERKRKILYSFLAFTFFIVIQLTFKHLFKSNDFTIILIRSLGLSFLLNFSDILLY